MLKIDVESKIVHLQQQRLDKHAKIIMDCKYRYTKFDILILKQVNQYDDYVL